MRKIIYALIFMLFAGLLTACQTSEQKRYEGEFLMLFDTVTKVVGYADSKEEFSNYVQALHDDLAFYHKLFDIYNDYEGINNIKTINDYAGIRPVVVDDKIIDLLKLGQQAYALSDGQVNIAMGAVLKIWHEHREQATRDPASASIPSLDALMEAAKHIDIENMIIDEQNRTVFLQDPAMSLDVGGIAKGYATECVVKHAVERGFTDGIASVGGNIRAFGLKEKPDTPWSIGIQSPISSQPDLFTVRITDASVVSSGGYSRYYTVKGKRYHHIIDPHTLMPADYFDLVTVICDDSGMADILSTAVFTMPFQDGLALIESLDDTEALWVFKDGNMEYSSGFEALLL